MRLVLASASPQRREILAGLGVEFDVVEPDVDELTEGDPASVALENARLKARAVRGRLGEDPGVVLAADTVVAAGGRILDKPADSRQARDSIATLAGQSHEVCGGIVLAGPGPQWREGIARSAVTFRPLDAGEVAAYVETGEWRGRAGGYAIQLEGGRLVESVQGDRSNVVGLSLELLGTMVQGLVPAGGVGGDRYNPQGRGSSFPP